MKNNENRNIQIKLRVNEKEFEQIQNNALATGKSVSAYIRETALNLCVFNSDTICITEHTREISAYRYAINQLVYTIRKTEKYSPKDLEYILDKTNEVLKSEKEFLELYRKSIESEKKLIARTIRKVIKNIVKNK